MKSETSTSGRRIFCRTLSADHSSRYVRRTDRPTYRQDHRRSDDPRCHQAVVTLDVVWNKSGQYTFGDMHYATGVSARAKIKRSDFGMTYALEGGMVGDEIEIILEFEGTAKRPEQHAATAAGRLRRRPSLAIYYGRPWRHARMDAFYGRLIRSGDLCFDLGAHVGNRSTGGCSARGRRRRTAAGDGPYPPAALRPRPGSQHRHRGAIGELAGTLPLHLNLREPDHLHVLRDVHPARERGSQLSRATMARADHRSRRRPSTR